MHKVKFISLEESDKDLVVSFAIRESESDIRSLILHRTLFFEEFLDENERGVNVSFEGGVDEEDLNLLIRFEISNNKIKVKTKSNVYELDVSDIERQEVDEMLKLLDKQNHDNKFVIHVA